MTTYLVGATVRLAQLGIELLRKEFGRSPNVSELKVTKDYGNGIINVNVESDTVTLYPEHYYVTEYPKLIERFQGLFDRMKMDEFVEVQLGIADVSLILALLKADVAHTNALEGHLHACFDKAEKEHKEGQL